MPADNSQDEMKLDSARTAELASNLHRALSSIKNASNGTRPVRLVAVSKLKPASDILALASKPPVDDKSDNDSSNLPHLHFGENYTQELLHKAEILPKHIRWHFIGALQTNKCKQLAENIPNLWAVESVDAAKKADALEKGRKALKERSSDVDSVRVFVQVNTSGEDSKSGVSPDATSDLAKHIVEKCPHLKLQGLMTIGAIARSQAAAEGEINEDFATLKSVRDQVAKDLAWDASKLELSMGMSADYEDAIRQGSDEIRIGTSIFGSRPPKRVDSDEKHDEEGDKEGESK